MTDALALNMIVRDGFTGASDAIRAMASARDVVDIYVIVDTGSTDGTPFHIKLWCRRNKKKLILREVAWRDDFAAARNVALAATPTPWVLSLDADDELECGACDEIRRCVNVEPPRQWYLGVRGVGLPFTVPQVRLFPALEGAEWRLPLHERISDSLTERGVPFGSARACVWHHGYGDPEHMKASAIRNERIVAKHGVSGMGGAVYPERAIHV